MFLLPPSSDHKYINKNIFILFSPYDKLSTSAASISFFTMFTTHKQELVFTRHINASVRRYVVIFLFVANCFLLTNSFYRRLQLASVLEQKDLGSMIHLKGKVQLYFRLPVFFTSFDQGLATPQYHTAGESQK